MKKLLSILMAMSLALTACSVAFAEEEEPTTEEFVDHSDQTIGIAMPTKSLERWNRDGEYLKQQFETAGYKVELKYSDNKTDQQNNDIQGMIADGVSLLLIAAIDGSTLSQTLDDAKTQNIPVIAYVRLIMNRWNQYRGSARSYTSGSTPAPARKSLQEGEYKSVVKPAEEWVPEE